MSVRNKSKKFNQIGKIVVYTIYSLGYYFYFYGFPTPDPCMSVIFPEKCLHRFSADWQGRTQLGLKSPCFEGNFLHL